jgi:hypothetical protein
MSRRSPHNNEPRYRGPYLWTVAKYLHLSNSVLLPVNLLSSVVQWTSRLKIFDDLIKAHALQVGCRLPSPSFLQDPDIFCDDQHISQQLETERDSG